MLTFRRHRHPRTDPAAPAGPLPWLASEGCAEFQATGLELELIDLVDERDRSRRAGFDDVAELEERIVAVQQELARVSAEPLARHPIAAA